MAHRNLETEKSAGTGQGRKTETPLSAGQLFGSYRILREIGRGGMGVVYLARETTLDRLVAVKVAYSRVSDSKDVARRILEEARSAAQLEHPGVVRIYAAGTHGGRPYVAMEYVAGQSLAQVLASRSPLDEGRALEVVRQVSTALAAAHAAGLVHGDVKPANIQLTADGRVKVMDFGIARPVGARAGADDGNTFVGTPDYASPEQALG